MISRDVIRAKARRGFGADDSGASLVEFSLVIALVLVLFFAILDFGRIGYAFVAGQKAVQNAARLAVVSPPVCTGVPTEHVLKNTTTVEEFGTQCSAATLPCKVEPAFTCVGSGTTATAIHAAVQALLPPGVGVGGLTYSYTYDPRLGFLGGPYTPMVTVEMPSASLPMISPLGPLLQLVGGAAGSQLFASGQFTLPPISVSMPGESLE